MKKKMRNASAVALWAVAALAPLIAQAAEWDGFHSGLHYGHTKYSTALSWPAYGTTTGSFDVGGSIYGIDLGYDKNLSGLVLGAGGDFSWSHAGETTSCPNPLWECGAELEQLGNLHARLGWASSRFMIYGMAGYAKGWIRLHSFNTVTNNTYADTETSHGKVYGGGIEIKADDGITARAGLVLLTGPHITIACTQASGPAIFTPS